MRDNSRLELPDRGAFGSIMPDADYFGAKAKSYFKAARAARDDVAAGDFYRLAMAYEDQARVLRAVESRSLRGSGVALHTLEAANPSSR